MPVKAKAVADVAPRGGVRGQFAGDNFNRPTDIAWDAAGDIFVTDAYTNARVVKLNKDGKFIKAWGSKGSGDGQFNMPNRLRLTSRETYTWRIWETSEFRCSTTTGTSRRNTPI